MSRQRGLKKCGLEKRGQVLVLGCLTLLLLALSSMLSFSVSHAVHERIRLQAYADAAAFSMAVVEARAMNYIAYSNRAIAATFVSMATTHAYVAAANSVSLGPVTGMLAMAPHAGEEAIMFHVGCVIQIGLREAQYAQQMNQFSAQKMKPIEEPLDKAVGHFVKMIQSIHKSQREAVVFASKILEEGIPGLNQNSAPCAAPAVDTGGEFGKLNIKQFACALESSPLDSSCGNAQASEENNRKRIMANVVNASRPGFISGKRENLHMKELDMANPIYHPDYVEQYLSTIPNPAVPGTMNISLEAYMADDRNCSNKPGKGSMGNAICAKADNQRILFPVLIHTPALFPVQNPVSIHIASGQGSGTHTASVHSNQHKHDQFKEMFGGDCSSNSVCFINYRMGDKANRWNQPLVFFVATQDLNASLKGDNCGTTHLPWHLNPEGQISIDDKQRDTGTLYMRPRAPAYAASQALVYFHRMDTWRAPPNLFEPYWRAKLDPFKREDFKELLGIEDS